MTQASSNDGGFVIFSGRQTWYSSSTDNLPQSKTKTKAPRAGNKNRASAKTVPPAIYPIFESCAALTTDPYWKCMMQEAAIGTFPRSFRYQNGSLTYRMKSKTRECPIPTDDPEQALATVRQFMMTVAGISSPTDIEIHKIEIDKRLTDYMAQEYNSWSEIQTTQHRTILIGLFVERIGNEFNLDLHQREALDNSIKLGILAGHLNSDNIHVRGNSIASIDGLIRDSETGQFRIEPPTRKIRPTRVGSRKGVNKRIGRLDSDVSGEDTLSLDREDSVSLDSENPVYTDTWYKEVSVIQQFDKFLNDLSKKSYNSQSRGPNTSPEPTDSPMPSPPMGSDDTLYMNSNFPGIPGGFSLGGGTSIVAVP